MKESLIIDASNRFFTMIPSIHPHVIRDEDVFKSKVCAYVVLLVFVDASFGNVSTLLILILQFGTKIQEVCKLTRCFYAQTKSLGISQSMHFSYYLFSTYVKGRKLGCEVLNNHQE